MSLSQSQCTSLVPRPSCSVEGGYGDETKCTSVASQLYFSLLKNMAGS